MIYSMTAFAREYEKTEFGEITFELRSVNQRYLEINFRLPELFRFLEPEMRTILAQTLQRGKIDVTLNFLPAAAASEIRINQENLQQLSKAVIELKKTVPQLAPIDPLALLKWPGIATHAEFDNAQLNKSMIKCFLKAVQGLIANREKEGAVLASIIHDKINAAEQQVKIVQQNANGIVSALRTKLQERVKALAIEIDSNRVEQEIVLQSQKADIIEELDRLLVHLQETRNILKKGGVVGRKLDFLMQELNREANTLGSKAVNIETTNASVELKLLIEQMREQIQNIE